jgi:hypothetical protein
VEEGARSQELGSARQRESSSSSSSIGACGMPGSVMLTANWSGFSIFPDASLGQKKCSRAYHPSIDDEDEDDRLPRAS